MLKYSYLILNVMILLSAVVVYKYFGVVRERLRLVPLMASYVFISIPFILWDFWATSEGHWGFNPQFTSGVYLGNLVLGEVLFFFSVPLVCLFIYFAVQQRYKVQLLNRYAAVLLSLAIGSAGLILARFWPEKGYTQAVGFALSLSVLAFLVQGQLIRLKGFWMFQIVLYALFFGTNSILTALPIIEYGDHAFIGLRIGTIPLEDFAYNFALINTFILVYLQADSRFPFRHKRTAGSDTRLA